MGQSYSKININQLEIDSVAEYVIHSQGVVTRGKGEVSSTKALDTDKVGEVDAKQIAVAADISDRHTVKNALQLGGIDASDYMTMNTGNDIATRQENMGLSFADDIKDVVDELYQMKNELIKKGLLDARGQYRGFVDAFKRNSYVNIQNEIGPASTAAASKNNELVVEEPEVFNSFDVYDFIVIRNNESKLYDIKQVVEKVEESKTFVLDSEINTNVRTGDVSLFKSAGIIHDGLYKFANDAVIQVSSDEFHSGLSDDSYNISKRINEPNKGFGYSFRIPEAKQGYLSSFEICAKAYGAPGSLTCYIIDSRDINKFKNPVQAQDDYEAGLNLEVLDKFQFFAKSQPVVLEAAQGKRYIKFNFLQDNGLFPLMTRDANGDQIRYVAIIEAQGVDASNYYDILFLQHKNANGQLTDLELNNITYNYKKVLESSSENALTTNTEINNSDMYYHIVTRGVTENEPEAQGLGLYTAHYTFDNVKEDFTASKARLTLKVKREGVYKVSTGETQPEVYLNKELPIVNDDLDNGIKTISELHLREEIYKPVETRKDSKELSQQVKTAVGRNIVTVAGRNDSTITMNEPALVCNDDKVYRIGYLVAIKARKVYFDQSTGKLEIGEYKHFPMPLVKIVEELNSDKEYSDKLIFECDLLDDNELGKFNDFEIQVYWENKNMSEGYVDIKKAQMGAIKDLVLSFVRGY